MPHQSHVVVWIDHLQARIFHVGATEVGSLVLHSHLSTQHLHHKTNTIGSGHVADDPDFLAAIEKAIDGAQYVLIIGPSTEKTALKHYLDAANVAGRSISVKSAGHPTDNEIIALARQHFRLQPARHTS